MIKEVSDDWRDFAETADHVASNMRSSDNCQYEGSEAEAFHARLYDFGPSRIDVIKTAHEGASSAISSYSGHLQYALSQMDALVTEANADHTAVNVAVENYNATLDTLELAAATGNTVVVAVLQSKLASDFTAYEIALGKWESDLQRASTIKTELGTNVDSVVAESTLALMRRLVLVVRPNLVA